MGMKVFLSCAFANETDPNTGELLLEHRSFLQYIVDKLRESGHEVYSALESGSWRPDEVVPEIGVMQDIDQLKEAEVVIAIVHDRPSAGVEFELGYAAALEKPVILARETGSRLSYFNYGAVGAGLVTLITFDNVGKLTDQLLVALVTAD